MEFLSMNRIRIGIICQYGTDRYYVCPEIVIAF